ncbi:hypothetical protein KKH18_03240 [bacterium]|nr:hypothetical protein [bacterium]
MKKWLSLILAGIVPLLFFACDEQKAAEEAHDPPTVTILSPSQDSAVEDTTVIEVNGADYAGNALARVVYKIDGIACYTDPDPSTGSPGSVWEWPTEEFEDGHHEITVVGYDHDEQFDEDRRTYTISNVAGVESGTGAVRSDGAGVISTPLGARIRVPLGAVPRDSAGYVATIVFSIEQDEAMQFGPPHGQLNASNVYKFGPSGFVFVKPVEITVPVFEDLELDNRELVLYRINPTTGIAETFAGTYNIAERTISAQTFELSNWAVGINAATGESAVSHGCVHVNNTTGDWMYLCVENYTLNNPSWDSPHIPSHEWAVMFPPSGYSWEEEGEWWLPQGSYTVCVQLQDFADEAQFTCQSREIVVAHSAGRLWGETMNSSAEITGLLASPPPASGECVCLPEPTIPVGTGDVQVTLTWWNTLSIDLDLWVYEPSGERCYYANPITETNGQLDRDNLCGNYENGRPENIFWQYAPTGTYRVVVDWFSDCGNGLPPQQFEVRVIAPGYTNTFSMSVLPDDTTLVTTFEIGSGFAISAPAGDSRNWKQASPTPRGGVKPDLEELKAAIRRR